VPWGRAYGSLVGTCSGSVQVGLLPSSAHKGVSRLARYQTALVLGASLALVLLIALPSLSAPITIETQQPTDPRAQKMKAGLEQRGMKVYDILIKPAQGRDPALWASLTAALYAAPNTGKTMDQAANAWEVMNGVLAQEPSNTVLIAAQVWNKYILNFLVSKQNWGVFIRAWTSATNDDQRGQAGRQLIRAMRFTVFDIERQQFIDQKDFVNKNFS